MAKRAPIQVIKQVWERIAPLKLAETAWDNILGSTDVQVGVMVEAPFPDTNKKQVLLTIDLTTAVCNEALELPSCSVIVSYHPPAALNAQIFRGLKSLTLSDPLQKSLLSLSARGISVFSPHTSLDATPKGINHWLVQPFAAETSKAKPISDSTQIQGFEGAGVGRRVELKEGSELEVGEIVKRVKEHLKLDHVQLATPDEARPIQSIAVCAGSGGSVFKGVQADLYLTGEMSHHEVLAMVAQGSSVILTNHTNTERGFLRDVLQGWLSDELKQEEEGWEVLVSQKDRDPLRVV